MDDIRPLGKTGDRTFHPTVADEASFNQAKPPGVPDAMWSSFVRSALGSATDAASVISAARELAATYVASNIEARTHMGSVGGGSNGESDGRSSEVPVRTALEEFLSIAGSRGGLFGNTTSWAQQAWSATTSFINRNWNALTETISSIGTTIGNALNAVVGVGKSLLNGAGNLLNGAGNLISNGWNALQSVPDAISNGYHSLTSTVGGWFSSSNDAPAGTAVASAPKPDKVDPSPAPVDTSSPIAAITPDKPVETVVAQDQSSRARGSGSRSYKAAFASSETPVVVPDSPVAVVATTSSGGGARIKAASRPSASSSAV